MSRLISSTEYYDQISIDYDSIMDHKRVEVVRDFVKSYCLNFHKREVILDFGAGTGGDTYWHLENFKKIIFYEPSRKMASYAMEKVDPSKKHIIDFVIGDDANLNGLIPYKNVDLVLSNFAVFNSIKDPLDTFKSFSKILSSQGNIVMVLYERKLQKERINKLFKKVFRDKKAHLDSEIKTSDGSNMKVYFHNKKDLLAQAKAVGFTLIKDHYFKDGAFRMYHFKFDS